MKKYYLLAFIFLTVFISEAQSKIKGSRIVTNEERTFDYFSKLEVNDKIKLILKQGSQNKLEVEADDNLHDVIDTDISNGVLSISLNKRIRSSKRFNLTLHVEDLDQITLKDDSEITSNERLEFFSLDLELNNKSDIDLENLKVNSLSINSNERSRANLIVRTDSLSITAKESSKLKLDVVTQGSDIGYAGNATIEMVGKGTILVLNGVDNAAFKGAEFIATTVTVNALDKSDSYVNAKESIHIEAKNKAEVYIFNKPEIILNIFEDNASIYKRESMTLLENL